LKFILIIEVTNTMHNMEGLEGSQSARIIDHKQTGKLLVRVSCSNNIINAMSREHKRAHGVLNDVIRAQPYR
jgi:hypothetical protein